jgi:hypothetical protein
MPGCDHASPFAIAYAAIQKSASEYRIVDYQNRAEVNYVLDLNEPASVARLSDVIMDYQPDVILCMETLEHINCHFEVMNTLADAVTRSGVVVFITVPNNGNWVFNALGWNSDHSIAFSGILRGALSRVRAWGSMTLRWLRVCSATSGTGGWSISSRLVSRLAGGFVCKNALATDKSRVEIGNVE